MDGEKLNYVLTLNRYVIERVDLSRFPKTGGRRTGSMLEFPPSPEGSRMDRISSPRPMKFGPYVAGFRTGELRKNGTRIRLQEKPLRVLGLLAEKQGQLVTRDELKKRLWPDDTFVDFETGLNTAVSKLRDALSDHTEKPRYIETVHRRGDFDRTAGQRSGNSLPLCPRGNRNAVGCRPSL